jgi:thiol:disulfide interchange protein
MSCNCTGKLRSIALFVIALGGLYFVNLEVQTYLGRRARSETGLQYATYEKALLAASTTGKPILVEVSAIWCSTCRKLDNEVFANADVREYLNRHFIVSRLEYESPEGQQFLESNRVSGFPSLWIVDSGGTIVRHLDVTFSPKEFLAELQERYRF